MRIRREQSYGGHNHAWRAVGALKSFFFDECLLHRMKVAVLREPFNGANLTASDGEGMHLAGACGAAVDEHRARTALSFAAAVLGPGESETVAQDAQQTLVCRRSDAMFGAVYMENDVLHVELILVVLRPQTATGRSVNSAVAAMSIRICLLSCLLAMCLGCSAADKAPLPPPKTDAPLATSPGRQTAVFAGGCFWGTQSVFERVKGVVDTTAGYSGGTKETATYEQVTSETTGHAESVKVVYDPSKIAYGRLLQIFFSVVHDPTELNRQGPDVGPSYRSAIFYSDDEQRRISEAYIAQLDAAKAFPGKIVTQVVPLKGFYDAEGYHQDYALHNPGNPYIMICDRPKISALRQQFPELFQEYKGK
jgi:peptide-methionine (S)-S-oxide reductase